MIHLSDTQRVLLSSASQRESGSILPFPTCITVNGGTMKSVEALLKRDLAKESETSEAAAVHRADGDLRLGVFVTTAGLAAIGADDHNADQEAVQLGEIVLRHATHDRLTFKAA